MCKHDDNGGTACLSGQHAIEVGGVGVLGALCGNVASIAQDDGRSIDVIVCALGNVQLDAVACKGLDIDVAVAGGDFVAGQTGPF